MTDSHPFRRHLPKIVAAATVLVVAALMIYAVSQFLNKAPEKAKKVVQNITLVKPPPPPPPPKVDEPPPPPEMKEEVKLPEPETPPDVPDAPGDDPPPGEALGLDAVGGAGGDGFGLVGRKGGRDLIGGGSGSAEARFRMTVKSDILGFLADVEDIRKESYEVKVKLWFSDDGKVTNFKLLDTTGSPKIDKSLDVAFSRYERFPVSPPENVNTIVLRITSRI